MSFNFEEASQVLYDRCLDELWGTLEWKPESRITRFNYNGHVLFEFKLNDSNCHRLRQSWLKEHNLTNNNRSFFSSDDVKLWIELAHEALDEIQERKK